MRCSLLFSAILAIGLLSACSGGDSDAGPGSAALRITNNSSVDITGVYVSPTSASSWGASRGSIASGTALAIAVAPNDHYDYYVTFADGDWDDDYAVYITAGETYQVTYSDSRAGVRARSGNQTRQLAPSAAQ